MKYTVNFTDQPDRAVVLFMAEYVGFRRMRLIIQAAKEPDMTSELFHVICSFAGVTGYPVSVAWKRYRKT